MKRILKLNLSRFEYGSYADLYACEKLPPIKELRKDYWQNIQMMQYNEGAGIYGIRNCMVVPDRNDDGVEIFKCVDHEIDTNRDLVMMYFEDGECKVNLRGDIDLYLIFPDWETKNLTIHVDNKEKIKIVGTEQYCQRYIAAFCLDTKSGKVYKSSDEVAKFVNV